MKSLIDILELSEQEIMELVNTAGDIIDNPGRIRTQVRRQDPCDPLFRALHPHPSEL